MFQVVPNSNETLGVSILKSRGFFPQAYWYWIGIGALIGYVFLFNFLFALALHFLSRKYFSVSHFEQWNLLELLSLTHNCESFMLSLQHSEKIKQAYPKRNCKREMLQQMKRLFSRNNKRTLLVSLLSPRYS